jgi:hypothetical protein
MLPAGERVEADDIYASEAPEFIKCTKSTETIDNEESEGMRKRAQARIEVLMGHFKNGHVLINHIKVMVVQLRG